MNGVIAVLIFSGVMGLIGGITNIQHLSMGAETTIVYYTFAGRVFSLAVGILSLVAAFACKKKKVFGWWLVAAMSGAVMLVTLWGIIRVITVDIIFALSLLAQTVLAAAFLFWWTKQKKLFSAHEAKSA